MKTNHFSQHRIKYLFALLVIILLFPTITNFTNNKPLFVGAESYYHLTSNAQNPLTIFLQTMPEEIITFVPLILGILAFFLFLQLAKQLDLSSDLTFFYLLLAIISPIFIWSFTTLSAFSLYLMLVLLGFFLLNNNRLRFLAIFPFVMATFFDLIGIIALFILQFTYFFKRPKDIYVKLLLAVTLLLLIINVVFLNLPLTNGPFHSEQLVADFISDLGGLSGISFFTIILASIGLFITWKKKQFQFIYALLPLFLLSYIINTSMILFLGLTLSFFAALALNKIIQKKWALPSIKSFTLLLLFLGIAFSSISYIERITDLPPLEMDQEALFWIQENTPTEAIVFSTLDYSYYIKHFAQRQPFQNYNEPNKDTITNDILSAAYIDELFPLLEENNITIIYLNQALVQSLPPDQGLHFLLKNERFKLIHSYKDVQVWVFTEEIPGDSMVRNLDK